MSIKQIYIDNANASSAAAKALKTDDFISKAKQNNAANKQAAVDTYSAGMDSQINNTQAYYDKQIGDTKVAYESQYQKNAVQKLINEKQIAERNANLGLTDSGLNRTQQTAAQLSYANQKGKIDLARQSALDEFGLKLTDAITTLQNEKASGIRGIEEKWDNLSTEQGINEYNTQLNYYNDLTKAYTEAATKIEEKEIDAAAEVEKERINAAAAIEEANKTKDKILWYNTGTYDNDKNPIFRNSEGKIQAFGDGINPYTSENNKKYVITDGNGNIVTKDNSVLKTKGTDTQKAAAYYGVCSNGYQPKGVIVNGEKQGTIKAYDAIPAGNEITGKKQNVWYTKETGKYWIWYGEGNTYVEVELIDGNWTVI